MSDIADWSPEERVGQLIAAYRRGDGKTLRAILEDEGYEWAAPVDLDALERRATEALTRTYGRAFDSDQASLWAQKGIEAMRLALAESGGQSRV